jgi:hypothetical protein
MKGNFHVQFGIGGDGSDPIADHTKERNFAPLINVSVEQLVPQDHFYRHLERTLDHTGRARVRSKDLCTRWSSLH